MRSAVGFLLAALLTLPIRTEAVASRIKDLVVIAGARDNQLVGYGLVVGLEGDGDKDQVYTDQAVANMLQRFGISVPPATLSAKNVAAVMVTGLTWCWRSSAPATATLVKLGVVPTRYPS